MKQAPWIKNAYKTTDVHWGKSQTKIMEMLDEVGITETRFTSLADRFIFEFMAKIDERSIPKAVRIIVPLRVPRDAEPKLRNKELNIIHRMLLAQLKAKFIAIGNGIVEFEQEFMSHLVITDKVTGRDTTLGESILPKYNQGLSDGTIPNFLLE